MRTFAFEDIDVGDGWVASFHATEYNGEPLVVGFWAAHADGSTVIELHGMVSHTGEPSPVVNLITAWCLDNCPKADAIESLSSKLRVERDLRARMKP